MPRWEPDGVERLQVAAFDLFGEQGFEQTTVAEIAERAGLSQRTFFHHFADKREVLFGLAADYQQQLVREIEACPDGVPPLDTVVWALQATADAMFEERRTTATRRQRIVDANPELRERELSKGAVLTDAIAAALRARGIDPDSALLTARTGLVLQQTVMQRWAQPDESRTLRQLLAEALGALRVIVGDQPGRPRSR